MPHVAQWECMEWWHSSPAGMAFSQRTYQAPHAESLDTIRRESYLAVTQLCIRFVLYPSAEVAAHIADDVCLGTRGIITPLSNLMFQSHTRSIIGLQGHSRRGFGVQSPSGRTAQQVLSGRASPRRHRRSLRMAPSILYATLKVLAAKRWWSSLEMQTSHGLLHRARFVAFLQALAVPFAYRSVIVACGSFRNTFVQWHGTSFSSCSAMKWAHEKKRTKTPTTFLSR
jgi:hypothetical protein